MSDSELDLSAMGFTSFSGVTKPKKTAPARNQEQQQQGGSGSNFQAQHGLPDIPYQPGGAPQGNGGRGGRGGRNGRGGGGGNGGQRGRGGRNGGGGGRDGGRDGGNKRQRTDGGPSNGGGGAGGHGQSFAHQQQGYIRESFFEDPWAKLLAARAKA